ncbi:MAG: hypothetical protein IMZ55_07400 [Acidobacteria bacterium]|nr:hypothetical protein [Acidobacteriota bacterium]
MADIVVVPAAVLIYAGAEVQHGLTCGAVAVTAGEAVYTAVDGSICKCTAASALLAAATGVTLNAASPGQPVSIVKSGPYNPGVAVTVGLQYGVTDTAGGIALISERAAADFVTVLGIATTTTKIQLAINKSGVAIA